MSDSATPAASRPQLDTSTDSDSPSLSVVLPAYNEAGNIQPLLDELNSVLVDLDEKYAPWEVLLVDDGSSDATRDRIHDAASTYEHVHGVYLRRNYGQSAALAAGIDHAAGDVIVTMDADRQNDPRDIPALLADLNATDSVGCVSGWRRDRDDPLSKRIPSRIQTHLAKLTGPDIHDFGCTLKAYDATALRDIQLYGEGHRYIPSKLYNKGWRVREREVNHRPRTEGSSHYGPGRLVRGFVDLGWHWFWLRYSTRPLHLLGAAGITSMILGLGIGSISLTQRFLLGEPLNPHTPRLILITLLITFGLQLLMFGVLAETIARLHYRDETPYRVREVVR